MGLLDRYLFRQIIPPFLLALSVLTFLLAVNPMLDYARSLLAKGVTTNTVGLLLLTLLPQAMSLTIPMAFLTGALMGLGRLSGDRESVALLACGVSPLRILRPLLLLGVLVGGFDMYVLIKLKPDANQWFRDITGRLLTEHGARDIKPRVFFEQFPQKVLYVNENLPGGVWSKVLLADTSDALRPSLTLAETGRLDMKPEQRLAHVVLTGATQYVPGQPGSDVYTLSKGDLQLKITAESVFGTGQLQSRGVREMSLAALKARADELRAAGDSPHNEIVQMHQMFSFPVACVVFALLALPLGLHTRKEGRLAGLALGLGVILAYYAVMELSEALVKGSAWSAVRMPAELARWIPNILLGAVGVLLVWWRTRSVGSQTQLRLPRWIPRIVSRDAPAEPEPAQQAAVPVIVLRLPRFSSVGPRILDRYLTTYYLRIAILAFVSLLCVYYLAAFVDLSDELFKGRTTLWTLGLFLWHSTPEFLTYVIPIAVLVAVLGTIGGMTRSSELMVMRACGVSLYRAALPMIVLALVWGGAMFAIEERVLADSKREATALNDQIRNKKTVQMSIANPNWLVGEDGRIYHYLAFEAARNSNGNRPTLYGLSVYETAREPYRLLRHTYARLASFDAGAWEALDGWSVGFERVDMGRREFARQTIPLPQPDEFRRAQIDTAQMSFLQLKRYLKRLGDSGVNVSEQRVGLHQKIAFPAVTLVMTLLAIPFGVTTGKKGALYGIGLAMILAGAYFLLTAFSAAAGAAGVVPPPLAAWAPNIVFAAGALYLMLTVRT